MHLILLTLFGAGCFLWAIVNGIFHFVRIPAWLDTLLSALFILAVVCTVLATVVRVFMRLFARPEPTSTVTPPDRQVPVLNPPKHPEWN